MAPVFGSPAKAWVLLVSCVLYVTDGMCVVDFLEFLVPGGGCFFDCGHGFWEVVLFADV